MSVGDEQPVLIEIARQVARQWADLLRHNAIFHWTTLEVRDLDAAARHHSSVGAELETRTDTLPVTDPKTAYGLRFASISDLSRDTQ